MLMRQRVRRVIMGSPAPPHPAPAPSPELVLPWILSKEEGEGNWGGGKVAASTKQLQSNGGRVNASGGCWMESIGVPSLTLPWLPMLTVPRREQVWMVLSCHRGLATVGTFPLGEEL